VGSRRGGGGDAGRQGVTGRRKSSRGAGSNGTAADKDDGTTEAEQCIKTTLATSRRLSGEAAARESAAGGSSASVRTDAARGLPATVSQPGGTTRIGNDAGQTVTETEGGVSARGAFDQRRAAGGTGCMTHHGPPTHDARGVSRRRHRDRQGDRSRRGLTTPVGGVPKPKSFAAPAATG
jgi:hypothetical protein